MIALTMMQFVVVLRILITTIILLSPPLSIGGWGGLNFTDACMSWIWFLLNNLSSP
jgi:hypothetical protein